MFIRSKTTEREVQVDRDGNPLRSFIKKIHLSTDRGSFIITRRGPDDSRWLRIHRETKSRSKVNSSTVQLIAEHITNG